MSEAKSIELRSSEIRKILDEKPSRLITWGTLIIIVAITAIMLTAWFIKYPEIVNSRVVITDVTPPVPVTTKTQGLLSNIFVEEGQIVEKGLQLATMKSAVDFDDAQELEEILYLFQPYNASTFRMLDSLMVGGESGLQLGEIEPSLNFLINAIKEYKIGYENADQNLKITNTRQRINSLKRLILSDKEKIPKLEEQIATYKRFIVIEQGRMTGDTNVTNQVAQGYYTKQIEAQQDILNIEAAIEAKRLEISNLHSQINLSRQENSKENSLAFEDIDEKTKYLKTQIEKWKEKYLLVAPSSGVISFYEKNLNNKKFFQTNDKVMAILPEETEELIGKVNLDVRYNGKVLKEQDVLIKLTSYPYQEYGKLRGKVRYKADIPKENSVAVEIELVNGLITTHGKSIPQDQLLVGTAEIITENKRLFQRIYERLF